MAFFRGHVSSFRVADFVILSFRLMFVFLCVLFFRVPYFVFCLGFFVFSSEITLRQQIDDKTKWDQTATILINLVFYTSQNPTEMCTIDEKMWFF